jgi:hypothetical protein
VNCDLRVMLAADDVPADVSPDAIRDAIRNSVWRSNALQMLIMKALKSPDDWIVYYAVIALQLFVDDGKMI